MTIQSSNIIGNESGIDGKCPMDKDWVVVEACGTFMSDTFLEYANKMRKAGLSEAAIRAFKHSYDNLVAGQTGMIPEISIQPVTQLPRFEEISKGITSGELLSQAKANVQAPWLGLTGFFSVAIMLSLLIFIGEAARDAFDPRKTFR